MNLPDFGIPYMHSPNLIDENILIFSLSYTPRTCGIVAGTYHTSSKHVFVEVSSCEFWVSPCIMYYGLLGL